MGGRREAGQGGMVEGKFYFCNTKKGRGGGARSERGAEQKEGRLIKKRQNVISKCEQGGKQARCHCPRFCMPLAWLVLKQI